MESIKKIPGKLIGVSPSRFSDHIPTNVNKFQKRPVRSGGNWILMPVSY